MLWCFVALFLLSVSGTSVLWVGSVTSSQASFRAIGYLNETFVLSLNEDLSEPGFSQLLTSDTAIVSVNNLSPLTVYYYGFLDNTKGHFRTFGIGRYSFKIGFGSSAATGSSSQVWSDLEREDLHLFIHMGDLHYNNIDEDDKSLFLDAFGETFASEEQAHFYHSLPIAYTWNSGDYGGDDSGATSPSRSAAMDAYTTYVPHYPLKGYHAGKGHIGQAFTVGNVRFIMPDLRSECYPSSDDKEGQLLSSRQMSWVLSELQDFSSFSLVVLVSSRHWIGAEEVGSDAWFGFPSERKTLSNFIAENNITNLVMLAGGSRMLAFDDGSHSDYSSSGGAGFPVMQAGPLDRWGDTKGGPFTHGCFSRSGDYNSQYGVLEVIDNPKSQHTCLHFYGRRVNEGRLIDWMKCTPLVKVGTAGSGTCDIDIMATWAWVAYGFGIFSIILLFVLCIVAYFCYITSDTKKKRTLISSIFFLVSMIILIILFPLLRASEANVAHRPPYLPVHSAYVLVVLAAIYIFIVTSWWDNKYQVPTITTIGPEVKDDSNGVILSDYSDDKEADTDL
eukprot:TRINITY_DN5125_c0_g1_i2.p1 TRINITY_DN5125_c0_g1~~TRINITY_DN5125_c0_g1_i2.p1  ORF type:complete len:559 (-),score=90.02 TRINITY_DN5125_c0_g1_i2:42-1718(-)